MSADEWSAALALAASNGFVAWAADRLIEVQGQELAAALKRAAAELATDDDRRPVVSRLIAFLDESGAVEIAAGMFGSEAR